MTKGYRSSNGQQTFGSRTATHRHDKKNYTATDLFSGDQSHLSNKFFGFSNVSRDRGLCTRKDSPSLTALSRRSTPNALYALWCSRFQHLYRMRHNVPVKRIPFIIEMPQRNRKWDKNILDVTRERTHTNNTTTKLTAMLLPLKSCPLPCSMVLHWNRVLCAES